MLICLFNNQAEFYALFGVSKEDAELAGWHPEHNMFQTDCEGFNKFLVDNMQIDKSMEIISLTKEDIIARLKERIVYE